MAFDSNKYKNDFIRENYDQILIKIPKGNKQKLKNLAVELDIRDPKGLISVSKLITNAIEAHYGIDITSKQ